MSRDRQRGFAASFLIPGLLLLVMGLGGTWGNVHGQSGGPEPEVVPTVVAGAEGEPPPPPRREAVAGESGEAPEAAPDRRRAVAGESGERPAAVAGESEEAPALIGNTGMDDSMRWSLLAAGMLLLAGGSLAFSRARKLR
jgi:LPXTG-motif cell wall-anchored protein